MNPSSPATAKRTKRERAFAFGWTLGRGLSMVLAAASLVTLFASSHWLADLLANLRVQQFLGLIAALAICVGYRRWAWAGVMLVCLVVHAQWFLSSGGRAADRDGYTEELTVTVANVLTHNDRYDQISADLLRHDPDVIVVLELGTPLCERLKEQMTPRYPYSITRPQDRGNFGIGLYSRFRIAHSHVFTLNTEIESIQATIRTPDQSYRVFATHPLPPIGARRYHLRTQHLMQLAKRIRQSQQQTPRLPAVLVGDLNLTPWSPHFTRFQSESGLKRASGRFDLEPTWYAFPLFPFGLVIDHVMVSQDLVWTERHVGPDIGSDHRSVTVTVAPVINAAD